MSDSCLFFKTQVWEASPDQACPTESGFDTHPVYSILYIHYSIVFYITLVYYFMSYCLHP